MDVLIFVAAFVAWLYVLLIVRIELAYRARSEALEHDYMLVWSGPGAWQMILDLRKWTPKQFYPSLAK